MAARQWPQLMSGTVKVRKLALRFGFIPKLGFPRWEGQASPQRKCRGVLSLAADPYQRARLRLRKLADVERLQKAIADNLAALDEEMRDLARA